MRILNAENGQMPMNLVAFCVFVCIDIGMLAFHFMKMIQSRTRTTMKKEPLTATTTAAHAFITRNYIDICMKMPEKRAVYMPFLFIAYRKSYGQNRAWCQIAHQCMCVFLHLMLQTEHNWMCKHILTITVLSFALSAYSRASSFCQFLFRCFRLLYSSWLIMGF